MKATYYIAFLSVGIFAAWMSGCAPVQFSGPSAVEDCVGSACTVTPNAASYDYDVSDDQLPVDILFISDNSGSMTPDQRTLGTKFPSFFNMISGYDFHVAITTTDLVSTRNGSSGSLVNFGDGSQVLTSQSSNAEALFSGGIQRPETAICDAYLSTCGQNGSCNDTNYNNNCPSPDSRAIYAANLVVSNNQSNFLRASAPLHVIILSNSDERVVGGNYPGPALQPLDYPSSLVQNVQNKFGSAKTLQVHTLIIQPGDTSCYNQEDYSATIFGQYAPVYASLASMTGGVNGSICANPYDTQLQAIGAAAQANLKNNIPLKCKTSNASLTYTFSPSVAITATVDSTGMVLNLSSPLPATTDLHLHYTCN